MTEAHDLSAGLLRQRRNLMLTSTALIFLGLAQAELHSFQLLGLHLTFGRPEAVVMGLLLITVYFTYRYALYLRQEPGPGLISEYYRRLNQYAKPKLIRMRDALFPNGKGLPFEENLGARKCGRLSWIMQVQSGRDDTGGFECGDMTVHFKQVWLEALKAGVLACLARSYFTDYLMPFFLAVIAVLIGATQIQF